MHAEKGKDAMSMKGKLFRFAAVCCAGFLCCCAFTAEAASSLRLKDNYATWRKYALYDDGMLKEYIRECLYGADPPDGYFFSTVIQYYEGSWYDSGFYDDYGYAFELYADIPGKETAVFYTGSQEAAEAAETLLQTYDTDRTGTLYERRDNCFSLNEHDPDRLNAIRQALTDAELTACFYQNVPVYEHRKLTVPYLTGYSDTQFYSPSFQGKLTAEYLQSYLNKNRIPCTIETSVLKYGTRFYVIPDEMISLQEHWALALRFYHDLGIVPDMLTDGISSQQLTPQKGACTFYDINADAVLDAEDIITLSGFLRYEGSVEDPQAGDMNADGKLNAADLTLLKRALLRHLYPAEKTLPAAPIQALNPTLPSVGTNKIPVFAVEFPDCTFPDYDIVKILQNRLFSPSDLRTSDYPFESVAGYYERASYGRMQLTGNVYRYTASQPIDRYADDHAMSLVDEILTAFDPELDFRECDADDNRVLDSLVLILPDAALKIDRDADKKPDWWPFSAASVSQSTYDGVRTGKYCVIPYDLMNPAEFVSKIAHELGHAMGLPDYYRYETENSGDEDGLPGEAGNELMDDGRGDLCACSKLLLGWLAEDEIQVYIGGTQTFYIGAFPDVPSCILIPRDPEAGLLSEYFLIEYVTQSGNQPVYGKSGIRILHVDAEVSEGDYGPELTYYNYGRSYDKSHQKQRVLRLVNDSGSFYPGEKEKLYKDTVDSSTEGFRWYDADGDLTLDPGLTVTINTVHEGPFYDPAASDPTAWISGFAQITVSETK